MLDQLAMRLDSAKNAAMARDVPDVLVGEAVRAQRLEVGVADLVRALRDLHGEVEHRALARRDVGLAVVDRDLVGDQRILRADAQDRAVRDDAVLAWLTPEVATTIISRSALVSPPVLLHQRVVVGEEGAELVGAVRERQEHVRHEARLLLHRQDAARMSWGRSSSSGTGNRLIGFGFMVFLGYR